MGHRGHALSSSPLVVQRVRSSFRLLAAAVAHRNKEQTRAAIMFQRAYRNTKGVQLFQVVLADSRQKKTMIRFQAICRGWLTRHRRAKAKWFAEQCRNAVPFISAFKANWHGQRARRVNREVPIALLRQRVARRQEAGIVLVVRFQRIFRAKIARE